MVTISPVILSGGAGTRLWPVSRAARPKHLLRLLGGAHTLLQETALRVMPPAGAAQGLSFAPLSVVGNAAHGQEVARQLAELRASPGGLVLEPAGRNTAPAAAVAALLLAERAPESLLLLLPADHYVGEVAALHRALACAVPEAQAGRIVTFGVEPTRPETGYGYIRRGAASPRGAGIFEIDRFFEKPDEMTAARYLESRAFYWNAGIFLAKPAVVLGELARHAAPLLAACRAAVAAGGWAGDVFTLDRASFLRAPAVAFDRAVMERTSLGSVVPVSMAWSDIGSWDAIWELSQKDGEQNAVAGEVLVQECRNSLVRAESRLVAVIGASDLVVIETADAVLVMPRARAQMLAGVVPRLSAKKPGET